MYLLLLVLYEDGSERQGFHSLLLHLCRQVADLQAKNQAERLEGDKARQLLAYEETRRCHLEEGLDQAQKHARDQHRSLQNQVSICAFAAAIAMFSHAKQADSKVPFRRTANT